MIKALDFIILRNMEANGRIGLPMDREPVRVATLLDEDFFNKDHLLVHHKSVFLEDKTHDWNYIKGKFYYYSRVAERADVLVVYEQDKNYTPEAKYCTKTGAKL
ncbi:hypothetical protein [Comamonas thiooxydans]|uniref:hypothetical protein n=1 Tax=Comamonas thiooxydans TaxID=363952 RepID=UPI000B41B28C|nr:hypothetical protein [Comamonas thiooxydans]